MRIFRGKNSELMIQSWSTTTPFTTRFGAEQALHARPTCTDCETTITTTTTTITTTARAESGVLQCLLQARADGTSPLPLATTPLSLPFSAFQFPLAFPSSPLRHQSSRYYFSALSQSDKRCNFSGVLIGRHIGKRDRL